MTVFLPWGSRAGMQPAAPAAGNRWRHTPPFACQQVGRPPDPASPYSPLSARPGLLMQMCPVGCVRRTALVMVGAGEDITVSDDMCYGSDVGRLVDDYRAEFVIPAAGDRLP